MTNEPVPVFSNGKTVTGIPMPHYLDWVANGQEGKRFAEQIFLPSIQRGFVWGPSKIVNLWDSLLRGMPIGSMLINRLRKGEKVFSSTNIQGREILSLKKDALGLLDGQQRTLAMLLGWPSESEDDGACIWVDLEEPGHNGAPFELRISTLGQPFGFQRHTQKKFSMQERREARNARFPDITDEESDKDLANNKCLKEIRPWKGKKAQQAKGDLLLYPLRDLWRIWFDNHTCAEEWSITLPNLEEALSASGGEVKDRFRRLCSAFERIYHRTYIPLVLYDNVECADKTEDPAEHPLVVLFNKFQREARGLLLLIYFSL